MIMTNVLLDCVNKELNDIDSLCIPSQVPADRLKSLVKDLYDKSMEAGQGSSAMTNLQVTNVDDDIVWEQLQIRDKPLVRNITKRLHRLYRTITASDNYGDNLTELQKPNRSIENRTLDESDRDSGTSSSSDDDDEEEEEEENSDNVYNSNRENEEEDQESDVQMEEWLDREDEMEIKRAERLRRSEQEDDEDNDSEGSDADLDYVRNTLYDSQDEEDIKADYKYADFFIADSERDFKNKQRSQSKKRRSNADSPSESSDADSPSESSDADSASQDSKDEDGNDDHNFKDGIVASNKKRSEHHVNSAVANQISALEMELLEPKSWELKGEVKATQRPENSLLEVTADIERAMKPTPVVTQEFTVGVEELIKERIKSSNFDDVQATSTSKAHTANSDTQQGELSQEKNRLGLGDVYAEDFIRSTMEAQSGTVSAKLLQERENCQQLFHKISRQLDALCHFHYTPRPIENELTISSNPVSSLEIEEAIPMAGVGTITSQQAPEDIASGKSGSELRSKAELTSSDKKKLRKANKAKKRKMQQQNPSKKESDPLSDKRVKAMVPSGKDAGHSSSYGKSASFFANLQEQAQEEIAGRSKTGTATQNRKTDSRSANFFKL